MLNSFQKIEDLISKAEIGEAIIELKGLCNKNDSQNYEDVIVLSSQFAIIQKKERLALGSFNQEISRIIKALLTILAEERKKGNIKEPEHSTHNISNLESQLSLIEAKIDKVYNLVNLSSENYLGDLSKQYYWRNLEAESKIYLSSAEKNMQVDGILDYSSVIIQYSKVLENEFIQKIFLPLNPSENFKKFWYNKVLKGVIHSLIHRDTESNVREQLKKVFSIVSEDKLIADLEKLVQLSYRNRAAHVGVLSKIEAQECRKITLDVLKNLMNRPY